jgi:hypothetical protein
LGTQLEGAGATRRFGHGGDNIGYKCLSTTYLERGMGAVVMTNGDDGYWALLDLLRAIAQEYGWPDYLPNRLAIDIGTQVYDSFVGEYELRPDFSLHIDRRGDRLYLQAPDQAPLELLPSSDTTFFARELNSEITFTKNGEGSETGLTLTQEEQDLSAKRVR